MNRAQKAGQWEARWHTFRLIVQPPFWKTGGFFVLLGLTLTSGLVLLYRSLLSRYKLRQQLVHRQMEAENLRQLDEMKSRFFANITHEFHTPLTLILGPLEQLLLQRQSTPIQRQLTGIETHARQLLNLINQLMDLTNQAPDPFLGQLYHLLDAHLSDPDFGVETMMSQLNLSRTNLFRKVKTLTGLSANDLLRQYRLKQATYYLSEGLRVSETAYRVGFESPAYFAKCFRKLYGLAPRDFVSQS
ncbi:helix-turn-helix domain-containing protein [Spirosoma validum]|uniref:histidine kinase n=1 Tax=Spirosoma validum TaxID=2771355 RepID=A0A927AZB4_9BACT|nr:helix-turn-helix domain-containing protein [Spirosoma validum]MBD2752506.1 helix-turn-helix domain-containing protein [Spirosoma validum]